MVHALNEIHRVLVLNGTLIDLRPLLDQWSIEVRSNGETHEAGRATDLPEPLADDLAADEALAEALRRGWFFRERSEIFPFFYYWDTPKEMQEYIDETWNDVINIKEDLWKDLRSKWAVSNADARVRMRLKMSIASFHKQISS